ncbi:CDGSH iron-sulfur domain-containing protein [Streptomyces sp. V3I7]|uniref:CDGSH iron-sulfur domain-containing protein n=1 Tax=Streptomyces sp. V3I7 TaxID=3042278 RepID=UPI00277FDBDD|nr:CDGSH iron-sulfur domain-containing protein [Streptomyces sp. V3I7]MDQ0994365.1 CDGSH-type Zn-finger protein [Streptomyces sp. V3I7]
MRTSGERPLGGRGSPPSGEVPRVTPVPGGPVLIEGPVEIVLPDGTLLRCERPVVALCTCRRTRRPPFCDTSHRGGRSSCRRDHGTEGRS